MLNTKEKKNHCDIAFPWKLNIILWTTDYAQETALCMYYSQEKYHENFFVWHGLHLKEWSTADLQGE